MSQPHAPETPPQPPAQPGSWAPPAAAPFGPPPGSAPAAASGYAPPAGYRIGPAASAAPAGPVSAGVSTARSRVLGFVALGLAILAAAGASLFAAVASFRIGVGAGREISSRPLSADFDWSILTPVRDWVLMGEVAFWIGTAIGLWALIQGIVAVVTARGRGAGIAAVVIAALGPVAFGAVVQGFLTAGLSAGTGIGG